jgi:hypothetical protein
MKIKEICVRESLIEFLPALTLSTLPKFLLTQPCVQEG